MSLAAPHLWTPPKVSAWRGAADAVVRGTAAAVRWATEPALDWIVRMSSAVRTTPAHSAMRNRHADSAMVRQDPDCCAICSPDCCHDVQAYTAAFVGVTVVTDPNDNVNQGGGCCAGHVLDLNAPGTYCVPKHLFASHFCDYNVIQSGGGTAWNNYPTGSSSGYGRDCTKGPNSADAAIDVQIVRTATQWSVSVTYSGVVTDPGIGFGPIMRSFSVGIFFGTEAVTPGDCDTPPVIYNANPTGYQCLGGTTPYSYNGGWGGSVVLAPETGC